MTDNDILDRAMAGECRADGSTFRVLVAEVRRLRSVCRETARVLETHPAVTDTIWYADGVTLAERLLDEADP